MRTTRLFVFASLAACGGSDSPAKVDAPVQQPDVATPDTFVPQDQASQYDFSCMGNSAPTTAPASITIQGTATDINVQTRMPEPVPDAAVVARTADNMNIPGAMTMTDAQGAFSVTIANPTQMPVDGYINATKAQFHPVRLYPPSPIAADFPNAPVLLLKQSTFQLLVQFAGATQSPNNGTVALAAVDCANTPIDGATISVKQGGQDVGTIYDASTLQPGAFFVFDVPPGATTVSATFDSMQLRAHDVGVAAGTTSTTIVRPGF